MLPALSKDWARRVWLTKEEEEGYYYGFANEGLWPLCHIAHVRPVFRSSDFARYREVNAKFADAVVAEARTDAPIVLVRSFTPAAGNNGAVPAAGTAGNWFASTGF